MKFLTEIKHRTYLIVLCWFSVYNISYYYKNILLFLLLKNVIYNQTINFYLIYTSISELFSLYFEVINFLVNNITVYYFIYHIFLFINNGLYFNEYKLILIFIYQLLIISLIVSFLIILYLFPLIWIFFDQFKNTFTLNMIHFEIKLNEYYLAFLNIYILFKCLLLIIIFVLLLLKVIIINVKTLKKIRKVIGILLLLLITIDNIFIYFIIYLIFIFLYEFIIFCFIYIKHYMVK